MGIQSLERLPEAELRALPPPVQSQLRAIRGLRSASRSMGLGSLAFDDASEFIAMLRDNVRQQKERLAEAERYRSTHAATAKLNAEDLRYVHMRKVVDDRRVDKLRAGLHRTETSAETA